MGWLASPIGEIMRLSRRLVEQTIAVSLVLGLLSIQPAFAYIDPGTGSYVIQVAIAFAVGALFAVKMFGKRAIAFFKKIIFAKKEDDHGSL